MSIGNSRVLCPPHGHWRRIAAALGTMLIRVVTLMAGPQESVQKGRIHFDYFEMMVEIVPAIVRNRNCHLKN